MAARIPSACLLRALRQLPYHQTACSNPSAISPITRIHHPSACRGLSNSTTLHLADHNNNNNNGNGKQRSSTLRTADLKPRRTKARTRKPAPDTEGLEERDSDPAANQGTDLNALDVFGDIAAPTTAIDACLHDGFDLNNGVKISGGDGCLLVDGEVFRWRPWESGNREKAGGLGMLNEKGQWEVSEEAWGVLKLVWPKPDLLILGLGASLHPLSPETRKQINLLGIRIEVQDTRNAAAQFNLLATERGVRDVAAALIPIGWREQ